MINFIKKFKKVWKDKYLSLYFSILITLCFAAYNAFLGINYLAIWNGSIALYYILLLIIKCIVIFGSNKLEWGTKELSLTKFIVSSSIIIVLTLALIVPSILMINHQRPVNLDMISAITVATFTTYKIFIAIKNFFNNRKLNSLFNKQISTINLVSAIVSILTMQNTLIVVSEEGYTDDMKILSIISTIVMLISIACISIVSMIKIINNKKNKSIL